jgi:hypothetical protein
MTGASARDYCREAFTGVGDKSAGQAVSTTINPAMTPATASASLEIVLKPRGRGRFDAFFGSTRIVAASQQAISDAARALHRLGYQDSSLLVARHAGAKHEAIRGPIGVWRKVRTREDRGRPRFVRWEPFPSRPVRAKERKCGAGRPTPVPQFRATRRVTRRSPVNANKRSGLTRARSRSRTDFSNS